MRLENVSVEDGLLQASINYIYQDTDGFIWVSTDYGVQVYDGYNFKEIKGPDGIFSGYSVYKTFETDDGLIWLDVYGRGLFTFDKKKQSYEKIVDFDQDNSISHYAHGENNRLWIATPTAISYIDSESNDLVKLVDLQDELGPQKSIYHIYEHRGLLYIATQVGTFAYHVNNQQLIKLPTITPENSDTNNFLVSEAKKVYTIDIVDEMLFLGTNDGVFKLDISNMEGFYQDQRVLPKYEVVVEHISVWQFYRYQNLLLMGANEGLYEYHTTTQQSNFILSYDNFDASIANIYVRTLLVDANGIYWMGSASNGLYSWDPKTKNVINYGYRKGAQDSLSNNQVQSILPHNRDSNKVWIATINGLNLIDLTKNEVEQFLQPADSKTLYTENHIYAVFQGLDQQLWLSTAVGLKLFDIRTNSIVPFPFSDEINQLISGSEDNIYVENGFLWYSSETMLFRVNLLTHELDYFPEVFAEIGSTIIWRLLGYRSSDPNEFWFATELTLWKFNNATKVLTKVYQHPPISDGEWSLIDSIYIDESADLVWIAFTIQGLIGVSLETNQAIHYVAKSNANIDNNIYSVLRDDDGDIWVSTHDGIFVFNPNTSLLRRFGVKHGLIGNEFNGGAFAKLADGRFAYGGMSGLSIFNPRLLKARTITKEVEVIVTNIELLSRSLEVPFKLDNNENIELAYDDVGIRIDFTTFNFASAKETLFEYRLNNQVFNPLRENYIVFPHFKSGNHRLQLRAKSGETGEYSKLTTLNFQVSYAPWSSPLAYALYVLAVLFILLFWLRRRHQQQAELLAVHEQVKFREHRLQLALKGSNSDVWDWHHDTNSFTANRFKDMHTGAKNATELGFIDFVAQIHPDDRPNFLATWHHFIEAGDMTQAFECTYRLQDQDTHWRWYKDLGKIVSLTSDKKPNRVTGSYTNITQSKVDEERAQYYGEAFRQTKDWVLIIDQRFTKVTSNEAIREVFGWQEEEFIFDRSLLGFDDTKIKFYTKIVSSLNVGQHWRGEELITTECGRKFHVILNITVGRNSNQKLHYIFVFTDITAQKVAENELRYMANYDHLTGLPNRSLLIERVEQAINRAKRKSDNLALFFIDLDGFKKVNDTFGHDAGDELLIEVAQRLSEVLRGDDTIARIGGDEFVILLERYSSPDDLAKIAQKTINTAEQPVEVKNSTGSIGCSIGIAVYPDDGISSTELLKNSDIAMYCAKQRGRNNFQFFESSMNDAAAKRLSQETRINLAAKNKTFINHYQPIVDALTGKALGAEMLMRWPSEDGMISPSEFIPLAEELNLIIAMTEDALIPALRDLVEWRSLRPDFYLSINISPIHFTRGQLVDFLTKVLNQYSLPTSAIKLEITESAFISEPDRAIEQMMRLKHLGFELSLDDFGTGYSSLSYVKKFPLDVIKIDRSFIMNIGKESADEAIIETIIILAKNLGMNCIAEGAETSEQVEFLVSRNCHYIQGYFYSEPRAAKDLLLFLK